MGFASKVIVAAGVALSACSSVPPEMTPDLRGVVVDQATHRPIAGATVRIKEFPQSSVTTGSDGAFWIPPQPRRLMVTGPNTLPGLRIAAQAPGYARNVRNWDTGDYHPQMMLLRQPRADDPPEE